MTLGPLEYVVVGFQDGYRDETFNGSIAREIERTVHDKAIRLVDVLLLTKTADGAVAATEMDNETDGRFASFAPLLSDRLGLFTPADVNSIAQSLPPSTAALVLLFEHRWAEHLKDAIAAAGGYLISRTVVPSDIVDEVGAELAAAGVLDVE